MKKIYSVILFVLAPIFLSAQGINFEHGTFKEALAKAKAENKLLFIDGYAVWCGPCKHMAKTVFMDEEVGVYFDENLVALKVDVERGEGPVIKRKYGISGLPGYVFIDGDGAVVYRFMAAMPKDKFMDEVKLAVTYSTDVNSVGRLAERYQTEQNDEKFVRMYLDKLHESNSTNYTDVLEHYLSIQQTIDESSKEMVQLLADHHEQIVFGGKADQIIQRNYGSDAWKLYVRKDIREVFQGLPKSMVEKTTDYAVAKKDTAMLEMVMDRAGEAGVKVDENQKRRTYIFYYERTGQGEKYKKLVRDDNVAFIQSVNVQELRDQYLSWKEKKAAGDTKASYTTPYAVRTSTQIASMVSVYAKFVSCEQDKEDVVSWMKVAYDIIPGDAMIMSQFANMLYTFGNDKSEAIKIKEKACEIAIQEDLKRGASIKADLELMKEGEQLTLK